MSVSEHLEFLYEHQDEQSCAMALIGVRSVVIPGKKEEPLIFTLDVPGGKKRLCVRKLSLWNFVAILSIGSCQIGSAFHWVFHILESTWKLSLLWELQLVGLCQATGFVGRTQ